MKIVTDGDSGNITPCSIPTSMLTIVHHSVLDAPDAEDGSSFPKSDVGVSKSYVFLLRQQS